MKPSIIAIIPARGGSKTAPRKNIRLLNGKPLIFYTLEEAGSQSILVELLSRPKMRRLLRMSTLNALMINPPIRLSDKPRHIPHGLGILANIIRDKLDIYPTFLDINAHRYTEKEVEKIEEHKRTIE